MKVSFEKKRFFCSPSSSSSSSFFDLDLFDLDLFNNNNNKKTTMHIESVHIDGFKSYATRVDIDGFDRFFNAITGLNGTGKSNILDAICFVLGISNLSAVRANSLQELIYKQGQAGVTKATVSVVFNNEDTASSPPGYEHCPRLTVSRQLAVGGRNKYLINGHVAQPTRVQNLFHSVGLNVNNPHFLIMQGKITKVLNAKPPEILGMLEEAAGTRMYESKKEAALRTLARKQVKVDEIDRLLADEVQPALERLRRERGEYVAWQEALDRLDALRRFCAAHRWWLATTGKKTAEAALLTARQRASELESEAAEKEAEAGHAAVELSELEAAAGGEGPELAAACAALAKRVARDEAATAHALEVASTREAARDRASQSLRELGDEALRAAADAAELRREEMSALEAAAVAAIDAATQQVAGARAGDGRDGSGRTLTQRAADARVGFTEASACASAADVRASAAEKRASAAALELEAARAAGDELASSVETARREVDAAQAAVSALEPAAARARDAASEADALSRAASTARDAAEELASSLAGLDFRYRHPGGDFQDSSVRGPIARLVRLKDPLAATALEVAAGGRLFQVVVDTDSDAKALLARGGLRSRVTIVPLNRIKPRGLPPNAVAAARQISASASDSSSSDAAAAVPAIELVGWEGNGDVKPAIEYAFGDAVVCSDAEAAKALAFAPGPSARTRAVTRQGDDFNPGGTLTGGSRPSGSASVLARLHSLGEAEAKARVASEAAGRARAAAEELAPTLARLAEATRELELKQHALRLLLEREAAGAAAAASSALAAARAELEAAKADATEARAKAAACSAEAERLDAEAASFASNASKHLEAAERALVEARAAVDPAREAARAAAREADAATAERDASAAAREEATAALADAEAKFAEARDAAAAASQSLAALRSEAADADAALERHREELRERDAAARQAAARRDAAAAAAREASLERRRVDLDLERLEGESRDASATVARLERDFPWIVEESARFNVPGSEFDFENSGGGGDGGGDDSDDSDDGDDGDGEERVGEGGAAAASPSRRRTKMKASTCFDPATAAAELEATERAAASASRGVNRRVLQMFDKAEAEFRELSEKKTIVQADRAKIQRVIAELDEKKRDALTKTWEKVDVDFGTIFSTLLPGTRAKLVPPEGAASFLEAGLEVRVAFGEVWKESLTELSGGQRSLLALSLILAMLLFKPAPIYILDEVDAALDLSHTQNVGRMIRRHFPYSQFLIVSLKEGMFANANVIFRTRFADGVSGVVRTENASAAGGVEEEEAQEQEEENERGGGEEQAAATATAGKGGAAVAGAPTATLSAASAGKGAAVPSRSALEESSGR